MADLDPKDIKRVQINVWLGKQQKLEILASETLGGHLCEHRNDKKIVVYRRTGVASRPGTIDVVCQLGKKLCNALKKEDELISILVDGFRIEPD